MASGVHFEREGSGGRFIPCDRRYIAVRHASVSWSPHASPGVGSRGELEK